MRIGSSGTALLLLVGGCGGKTLVAGGGGADSGARSTSDARPPVSDATEPGADGGPASPCPASPPSAGQACSPLHLFCEYDVTNINPFCNDLWQCDLSGWDSNSGGGSCPSSGLTCPDSYADVPVSQACTVSGQVCSYPTGTCGCAEPPSGTGNPSWGCLPLPDGCPFPIPALGSACETPEQTCDYGSCIGGVELECVYGFWGIAVTHCFG